MNSRKPLKFIQRRKLKIAVGSRKYDPAMDVNGDGQITSLDALMILQAAAGKISL